MKNYAVVFVIFFILYAILSLMGVGALARTIMGALVVGAIAYFRLSRNG